VVLPAAGARDPIIKQLVGLGAPTVLIGHRSKLPGVGWVDCTHDTAATELTQLMISGGRRSLVLINGPTHVSACKLRSTGFWTAVKSAGIPGAREIAVPFDTAAATSVALDLLRGPNRPDAIAAGVLEATRTVGLSVPDDVAISGFDDRSLAAHTQPALTTVRMPLQETGHAAAHMLFAMLGDEPLTTRRIVLPTEVVIRDSTPRPTNR
jgi:LacI family transcriptional regulator